MSTSQAKQVLQLVSFLVLASVVAFFFSRPPVKQPPMEQVPPTKEAEAFHGEVTVYNETKSFPGYTLYPVVGTAQVLLLDMKGDVVHHWPVDAQRARLLPNGNLLVVHGSKWGTGVEPWKTYKFSVREYDWNGTLVWEYDAPGRVHHDVARLPNGNTLFPYRTILPPESLEQITSKRRKRLKQIRSDAIIEVSPFGRVVWNWKAEEHLDVNSCGKPACTDENAADWTHVNTTYVLPENRFFDGGDERFRPGNLLILIRNWWTAMILDRETGEPVWEYTGDYKGGLSGGHEAVMIEPGLPGAGNILIFDNGRKIHQGESYALEINPQTKELVWVYDNGKKFFSNSAGALQRLPNGNTLISEDLSGRVFEVTPEKEIVWEYKGSHRIARAKRYPYEYVSSVIRKK
ncbi:MAG: aryl-sulfate sulfotransferase [Bdellovibrionales bacterium]|nr:aryl-sulfate sulfotransferase [Bdellovibrionales bacterium]